MTDCIVTEKLTKKYKALTAVNEVSLHVRQGEIFGFLGLNGAGKTTTIRMLLGMIKATSGTAFINGKKVYAGHTALWKEIGYMVEIPASYPNLTVKENLEIFRRLRLIEDKNVVKEITGRLRLRPYYHCKARHLSTGNAQRLGLAKALIHNPSILILDEPSNGLDPEGIFEIRELLMDLALNKGVTIFISSHILSEIAKFANRIGIIHQGHLVQQLGQHELETLCRKKLLVATRNNDKAMEVLKNAAVPVSRCDNTVLEITSGDYVCNPEQITLLLTHNDLPPCLVNVVEEDLESYFLRTIKETP